MLLLLVCLAAAGGLSAQVLAGQPGDPLVTTDTVTTADQPVPQVDPQSPISPVPPVVSPYPATHALQMAAIDQANREIRLYQKAAWRWQSLMGLRHTPTSYSAAHATSVAYTHWVLRLWKSRSQRLHIKAKQWMVRRTKLYQSNAGSWRLAMGLSPIRQLAAIGSIESRFNRSRQIAQKVYRQFQNPPQKASFECIHGYEGSWTDRDSGGNGHYGGIQFGKNEWLKFGYPYTGKLWAYQATKLEQLWAAYRYWLVSGFRPWPQTASVCGLL
jgi:hypothetical protein